MQQKPIMTVSNLSKVFNVNSSKSKWYNLFNKQVTKKIVVNNINFTINKGDFVAFLGPNGAGKSTTIKMLTGILTPTSGKILVNNLEPHKNRSAHAMNIGVVFGQRTQLWWDLPAIDSFKLLYKMYNIPVKKYKENLQQFTELLALQDFISTPVRKLSLGQKMRCELAAALLHEPKILFLDEPTIGLDLFAKEAIRDFLKKINKEKHTTILLTTHDLEDVENLCEKVIIIDKGDIVKQETLDELKASLGEEKIIAFEVMPFTNFQIPNNCYLIKKEDNTYYLKCNDDKQVTTVIHEALSNNKIHDITFVASDITEIIKRAYNDADTKISIN